MSSNTRKSTKRSVSNPSGKRQANIRTSREGGRSRSSRADSATATEFAKMEAEIEGGFDALREMKEDIEQSCQSVDLSLATVSQVDEFVMPEYRPIKVPKLYSGSGVPPVLTEMVKGHFAAFGYNEKAWLGARSNALRWWAIAGKPETGIAMIVKIIDEEYETRSLQPTWFQYVKFRFAEWCSELPYKRWFIGSVVSSVVLAGFFFSKKPRVVVGLSLFGVGTIMHKIISKKPDRVSKKNVLIDHCTGMTAEGVPEIDEGSVIVADEVLSRPCKAKEMPVGFSFGLHCIWVPRACWHNELNALVTRQLQPRVATTVEGERMLSESARRVEEFLGVINIQEHRSTWKQLFLERYPAGRRKIIQRAMNNGLPINTAIDAFGKIEVSVGKPVAKRKVRFVSGFHDEYLGATGPDFYIWFKNVCRQVWSPEKRLTAKYLYTGSMDALEVGEWFSFYKAIGWKFMLTDFSKFDSRVKEHLLSLLHTMYKKQLTPENFELFIATFHKYGRTKQGIKFSVSGTVASGRADTTGGNSLIVQMCCDALLYNLLPHGADYRISNLGDDANSVFPPQFQIEENAVSELAATMGHEITCMIIDHSKYHLLEFCSQRVWNIGNNIDCLGPKPGRLLSKTFVCHRFVPRDSLLEHVAGVMEGLKFYSWVPLFRAVYQTFFARHPKVVPKKYYNDDNEYKLGLRRVVQVDSALVEKQFYEIYGFYPEELEDWIKGLEFDMGDSYRHPLMDRVLEIDGVSYDYDIGDYIESCSQARASASSQYFL